MSTQNTTATLTIPQQQALALLAQGISITATAEACKIHRTTIHHWKRNSPDFSEALFDAKLENADHWRAEIQKRAEAALATIDALLADPKTPATVKLKLALYILTSATAAPAALPVPIRLPAPAQIQHISTLDEFKANLDKEEAQIKEFIGRQKAAGVAVDIPAAYGLPANMIPPQLQKPNSSQFDTPGRNTTCPCKSGKKFKQCCLNKKAA